MAKAKTKEKFTYNINRGVAKKQRYVCNICQREYNNENFFIADERDCPICDNRDCARKIS